MPKTPKREAVVAKSASTRYEVPALTKAIAILDALKESQQGLGWTDICSRVNVPKSSAFLILNTLESHGYVEKNEAGKYFLGLKLFEVGMMAGHRLDLRRVAKPHMTNLRDQTGFTVHLAIMDKDDAIFIEKIDGTGYIKFATWVGQRVMLHLSSVGKILAAELPEETLEQILHRRGMPERTPNTLTTVPAFKEALAEVRRIGYAIEDEEDEPGIRCVGAPLRDHEGKVAAAISVTALRGDLPATQFNELARLVIATANRISNDLGWRPEVS